ncbi:MAG: cell division protein FtsQ/DivIB [Rhodothermia bacterium]
MSKVMSKKSLHRQSRKQRASLTVRFAIVATSIVVVFAVTWATYLASTTTIQTIEVAGSRHASIEGIVELAGVHPGDTLFAADPDFVAARVARHPWIEEVTVTRWPTGTLSITVRERTPVTLVVGRTGLPLYYLDRDGVKLPIDTLARYDVPLLRGFDEDPKTIADSGAGIDDDMLELLHVLAMLEPEADDLISDVVLVAHGEVELLTVPFRQKKSIRVKLGRGKYEQKFARLVAFWKQAVVGRSDKSIEWIDLRFNGQVVTKET